MAQAVNIFKTFKTESSSRLLLTLTTGHLATDFYGLVLPFLLPALITAFSLNYAQAGLLAFATIFFSGFLEPIGGYLGDRKAWRKRILIAGFIAYAIGFGLIGLSNTYLTLLIACFVISLGQAAFHPQSTNLLTRTFAEAKGRAMGFHGIGGAIGNFLSPLTVAFLVSLIGWQQGAFVLMIPALLIVVLFSYFLTEPGPITPPPLLQSFSRELILLAINVGFIIMLYKGFLTFLPTYLVEQGISLSLAGGISALMLLVGLLAQPTGGVLFDRWGGRTVLMIGALGSGLALTLFTFSSGIWLIIALILVGAFTSALFPVALAMGSDLAKGGQVGMSVGVVFGISGTMSGLTPVLMGQVADQFDLVTSFRLLVIFAVMALVLTLFLPKQASTVVEHP